jgi:hypothetical protein
MTIEKLLLLASIAALTACNATAPVAETTKETKPYVYIPEEYVSISCVTHGTGYIHSFAIEEPVHSGPVGGRMAGGASCGGLIAAGYALPKTWFPGMKVKVRWKPNGREWVEKTTNIMRYEKADKVVVHFFPNDQVRVVSSIFYPESPKHPISENATVPPSEEQ